MVVLGIFLDNHPFHSNLYCYPSVRKTRKVLLSETSEDDGVVQKRKPGLPYHVTKLTYIGDTKSFKIILFINYSIKAFLKWSVREK